jgi:glutaredoxin
MPAKTADLYRMVFDKHVCPYGIKARHLLRARGYAIADHPLRNRAETDAFKAEHQVGTTPQIFIDGTRIGGYDALRGHFGLAIRDPKAVTYRPVIALFALAAGIALAASWAVDGVLLTMRSAQWFVGIATVLLALQKLRDVDGFATMFLGYDLLARRWLPYATLYPFAEALAGLLMIAGALRWVAAPLALLIGGVGAVSVFYAVYIQKRDLKCACVGGGSNVPLGFVSLTENLMMVAMGIWMIAK